MTRLDRLDRRMELLEKKMKRIEGIAWYLAGLLSVNLLGHEAIGLMGFLWRIPI